MRFKLALLTTAMAFGLGTTVALAEDAPGAKSDITIVADQSSQGTNDLGTEGKSDVEKPGALSAPNKDDRQRFRWRDDRAVHAGSERRGQSDAAPGKGAAAQPGSDKGDNM